MKMNFRTQKINLVNNNLRKVKLKYKRNYKMIICKKMKKISLMDNIFNIKIKLYTRMKVKKMKEMG
jgi:hypothetical protein